MGWNAKFLLGGCKNKGLMFTRSSSWTPSIPEHTGRATGALRRFFSIPSPLLCSLYCLFTFTLFLFSCSFLLFSFSFPFILSLSFFFCPCFPLMPVFSSLSYRGLVLELTASLFLGNFVLAVLLLSMAHLFAPVKEKKKKNFSNLRVRCLPRDPCLNLCCKIFFFPYEVPKK